MAQIRDHLCLTFHQNAKQRRRNGPGAVLCSREDLLFGHDEIHGDVMGKRMDRVHFLACEPLSFERRI